MYAVCTLEGDAWGGSTVDTGVVVHVLGKNLRGGKGGDELVVGFGHGCWWWPVGGAGC